jgi:3-oxoacyl-[acyl-carrier protein] reductase
MDLGLQGKVALVPAASSGLGRAIAEALRAEGARLALCARGEIDMTPGENLLTLQADVSRADDIQRFVEAALARFGGIDILVANAGGPPLGTFEQFDDAAWQAAFELTLLSAIRLVRGVLPAMRQRGGGSIVLLTSSSVKEPIEGLTLSNVIRASVAALSKSLSNELATDNIRVNQIIPGTIATGRVERSEQTRAAQRGVDTATVRAQATSTIPMGRYGEPREFADGVVFMLSEAASYITGATLQIDGGRIRSVM